MQVWQLEENADDKQDKTLNIQISILSTFHHYDIIETRCGEINEWSDEFSIFNFNLETQTKPTRTTNRPTILTEFLFRFMAL